MLLRPIPCRRLSWHKAYSHTYTFKRGYTEPVSVKNLVHNKHVVNLHHAFRKQLSTQPLAHQLPENELAKKSSKSERGIQKLISQSTYIEKKTESALHILVKANRHEEARQLFSKIPDDKKNIFQFNIMLASACNSGNEELFNELLQQMDTLKIKRTSVTWLEIAKLYIRTGSDRLYTVLEEMKKEGETPTESIFTLLMTHYVSKGMDKARELLASAHEYGCKPTIRMYTPILTELIKKDNEEEIVQVIKEIEEQNLLLDRQAYSLLIIWKIMKGETDKVKELYTAMRQQKVKTDEYLIEKMMDYFAVVEPSQALLLLEDFKRDGGTPTGLIYTLALAGCTRLRRARAIYQEAAKALKADKEEKAKYSPIMKLIIARLMALNSLKADAIDMLKNLQTLDLTKWSQYRSFSSIIKQIPFAFAAMHVTVGDSFEEFTSTWNELGRIGLPTSINVGGWNALRRRGEVRKNYSVVMWLCSRECIELLGLQDEIPPKQSERLLNKAASLALKAKQKSSKAQELHDDVQDSELAKNDTSVNEISA